MFHRGGINFNSLVPALSHSVQMLAYFCNHPDKLVTITDNETETSFLFFFFFSEC